MTEAVRKRTVSIAPGQDPAVLNTGVLAYARHEKKLSKGRDYSGGRVVDVITEAVNGAAALVILLEALATGTPSAKLRKQWISAVIARGADEDVVLGAVEGARIKQTWG